LITGSTVPTFDKKSPAPIVTSAIGTTKIYVRANLKQRTDYVTKEWTISICDGETITSKRPDYKGLVFDVGQSSPAVIPNLHTEILSLFESLPVNTADPTCNMI
jgi:hypothetical protein